MCLKSSQSWIPEKLLDGHDTKIVENFDFLSILYSKPLLESRKSKFEIGDGIRISKYDLPFRKGH